MKIAENVHLIQGGIGNIYLITDPAGALLIDTGLPRSGRKILAALADLGLQPADLRWIVITHADADHTGSLNQMRAASPARTYADPIEARAIQAGKSSRELKGNRLLELVYALIMPFFKAEAAEIDETVGEGFEFPVLGGLRVLQTPGHTPGHISLFSPATGILFAGDSVQVKPDRFIPSAGFYNWDAGQFIRSFHLQAALHPKIVCAGHGWTGSQVEEKFARYSNGI